MSTIFTDLESNVRSYCRHFLAVFDRACNALLYTIEGERYIDFLAGAGALNYGHNNEYIQRELIAYLQHNGITLGLDLHTTAKQDFLHAFKQRVLDPARLDYKVQFCGPTGTNAVEAALKLARRVKSRPGIFAFMGAYHGLSLGSLATTGNALNRAAASVPLPNVTFFPYPSTPGANFQAIGDQSLAYLEMALTDPHAGIDKPAAVIVETVQAEGGVMIAPLDWLRSLRQLCDRHDILLICDDIQVGCGRTGPFCSFESAGIVPHLVTLSKSISDFGLPMALLLIRPDLDVWEPGEHTGTFRGDQLAFVGASAAPEYRDRRALRAEVAGKEEALRSWLARDLAAISDRLAVRGVGMIWGIDFSAIGARLAGRVSRACFERGLIAETIGRHGSVLKVLPPLTIEMSVLEEGCHLLVSAIAGTIAR